MSRLRTLPGTLALFVGPTPATGAHATGSIQQIYRVQSLDYSWSDSKQDVEVYGIHGAIGRDRLSPPTVDLSFSYYLTDLQNEKTLGMTVNNGNSMLSDILLKNSDEKNYFVLVTPEGVDVAGRSGADGDVVGFGNGYVSSYSVEGAVGSFPTASVQVQALTMIGYSDGVTQPIPAVDSNGAQITSYTYTISTASSNDGGASKPLALRPQDITLDLTGTDVLFHDITNACIQSFRISYDLNRQPVECLGSRTYRTRDVQFPINVQFQVEAFANDLRTGSLVDFQCLTGLYAAAVTLRDPSCTGGGTIAAKYTLSGLSLESQNWSTSAGNAQTLSISWVGQITASGNLTRGVFASGVTGRA